MSKKIKLKHVIVFSSFLFCLNSLAMEKEPDKQVVIEKAKAIVENAKETIKKIPDLIQRSRNKNDARKQKQLDDTINQFKDQNTVLVTMGEHFAFYKGDLVKGSCFALDLGAEIFTYKKLFEQKVDYVLDMIKEDSQILEGLVQQAQLFKENDKRNGVIKFMANIFSTPAEISSLKKYIHNNHKMIGYNPFKLDLLPYILLNLVKTKVLHFVEKSFLTEMSAKYLLNNEILKASQYAYQKDVQGNLHQLNKVPFSVMSILMFIINPRYMFERINFLSPDNLKLINKFFSFNIPDFIFTDFIKSIASLASLGLAIKLTDTLLNTSWSAYVLKNQEKFLKLLERYNIVKNNEGEILKRAEQELRKFIYDGHVQGILSQVWIQKKEVAQMRMNLLLASPIIGALGWKAYSFYKASSA